jgi:peptidoglycan/LPS O-acetylase OafA/YrhL
MWGKIRSGLIGEPPLTFAEYQETRYFPALDGVRALAILLVFTAHVIYVPFWRKFNGGEGVTIFFVLSGYLITTLALREETRRGALSLTSFYIRRIFRIYPLYFATIAVYCLLIYGMGFVPDRRAAWTGQLPYYLFGFPERHHFANVSLGLEGGPPLQSLWSIGVEEKFYLLWPLLGFVLLRALGPRFRLSGRILVCLAVFAPCALAPTFWDKGEYVFNYIFIVYGVMAAVLLHERAPYERLRALGWMPVALAAIAVAGVLQVVVLPSDFQNHDYRVLYGAVVTLALVGITLARGNVAGLRSRPMVFLGVISYVFYLSHSFSLNLVEKTFLGRHELIYSFGDVLLALPLAIAVSWLVHIWFEQPIIDFGHRLARRDKPFHGLETAGRAHARAG